LKPGKLSLTFDALKSCKVWGKREGRERRKNKYTFLERVVYKVAVKLRKSLRSLLFVPNAFKAPKSFREHS